MSPIIRSKDIQDRPVTEETIRGVGPTRTVGETYAPPPVSRWQDLMTLCKVRVTSMVVMTAWTGYFIAQRKSGGTQFSWDLLATLSGIALVSAGASALNQVLEREVDSLMIRTKDRPLPAQRMLPLHAAVIGCLLAIAGAALLATFANLLTAALALATAATYLLVYTPLKKITPVSTFIGAFPGAMPPLLGYTAVTGRLEYEALTLFAIVFFWQFPHFLAIAWLYREDYERAGIRMLPVIDPSGQTTIRQILLYGIALIPVSVTPYFARLTGMAYVVGAIILGVAYLGFGIRLARLRLPPSSANSKKEARDLLRASVIYLPLLLLLLMLNGAAV